MTTLIRLRVPVLLRNSSRENSSKSVNAERERTFLALLHERVEIYDNVRVQRYCFVFMLKVIRSRDSFKLVLLFSELRGSG